MQSLNEQAHTFAFDILFSQLKQKLSKVPHLKVGVSIMVVIDLISWFCQSGLGNWCDESIGESEGSH